MSAREASPISGPSRRVSGERAAAEPHDVALLCNPRAGKRWRVLTDLLDSDAARQARRIVTDDIEDVEDSIRDLGRRVRLLCIYGGDGTIFRVVNALLRDGTSPLPRLALIGGGTMNVTARQCGMRHSPRENLRDVIRAYRSDRLLWQEVPVVAVTQGARTQYGFTFGLGPLVRILERFEAGKKSRLRALLLGVRSIASALTNLPADARAILSPVEAQITADGQKLPHRRWAAIFANVTGSINPFVEPFTKERTQETFHFHAYAVSLRELALALPMLARAHLPIDTKALWHPAELWRRALLAFQGGELPTDPRYVNDPARHVTLETAEPHFTIDGEIFPSTDSRFELRLGPSLQLAILRNGR